jgi:predicted nucleic-acid-binding protein
MIGLDTNVLVRYLTQDDPVQAPKATQVIEAGVEQGEVFYITSLIGRLGTQAGCAETVTFDTSLNNSPHFRLL